MKAHAHTLTGTALWMGGAVGLAAADRPLPWGAVVGGALVASGAALAPDMDTQSTAPRSLGWPGRLIAYGIAALTKHRGASHWLSTGALVTFGVAQLPRLGSPWPALLVLAVCLAWCEAGYAADQRASKRIGPWLRWAVALGGAWALMRWDTTGLAWLAPAFGVGFAAHLLGDLCTTGRWPVLAPLIWRKFGGWRVVRPAPPGQRVHWTERWIERGLWASVLLCVVTLAGWWPHLAALADQVRR